MPRWTALRALLIAGLLTFPASAAANGPEKVVIDDTFSGTLTTLCPFPVAYTGSQTGHALVFRSDQGALERVQIHATEQLLLTANGRSLTVDPFPFNQTVRFVDGELTHVYLTGLVFRVDLPNGSTFLSAGRFDFVAAGVDFTVVPDVGRSGDVTALCAALSP